MAVNRSFTPEFKREAVSLVLTEGFSIPQACRALEIGETALRRWVNQAQRERKGITPQAKALTPEHQRIQELEARVNRLEREKAILKKATALLMSDEFDPTR
jgi:transposase